MEFKEYEELTRGEVLEAICEDLNIQESEINVRDIVFRSREEAEIYFGDIIKLYDNVLVKYVKLLSKFEDSAQYGVMKEKIDSIIGEYLNFPELLLDRMENQKSNQKGCGVCKSSINKDHYVKNARERLLADFSDVESEDLDYEEVSASKLDTLCCPVCRDRKFVMTETDESKLKSIKNRVNDAIAKLEEEKAQYGLKHGQKIVDLIGFRMNLAK